MQLQLSIIVPTYNEAANLPLLLSLIHTHLAVAPSPTFSTRSSTRTGAWFEVVVVDDGSPDGTAQVASHIQATDPAGLGSNLVIVERPGKLGLGTAYAAGLEQVRGTRSLILHVCSSSLPDIQSCCACFAGKGGMGSAHGCRPFAPPTPYFVSKSCPLSVISLSLLLYLQYQGPVTIFSIYSHADHSLALRAHMLPSCAH